VLPDGPVRRLRHRRQWLEQVGQREGNDPVQRLLAIHPQQVMCAFRGRRRLDRLVAAGRTPAKGAEVVECGSESQAPTTEAVMPPSAWPICCVRVVTMHHWSS
jgi:hypothetical protein